MVAVTIGSYKLCDYVDLNLAQCRKLFDEHDPYFLVSDDRSPRSKEIEAIAKKHGASYVVGEKRRSHFTGDLQSLLHAAKFGELTEAWLCIKLSQRFVPAHPDFVDLLLSQFGDLNVAMVLPGQPQKRQMARPSANFYSQFGLLTDCMAWRPAALPAEKIEQFYRDQLADITDQKKGKHLVEVTMGRIAERLLPGRVRMLDGLANHQIGKPKLYLRKAQSNSGEYRQLAKEHGLEGTYDTREWVAIEGKDYIPVGVVI